MSEQVSTEPISSIGHLGVAEVRQDQRYYLNAGVAFETIGDLHEAMYNHVAEARQLRQETGEAISRVVLRGVVSDQVREDLKESPLKQMLEVAVPLRELGRPNNNLIYLAEKDADRVVSNDTLKEMMEIARPVETLADLDEPKQPLGRLEAAKQADDVITTSLTANDVDMMLGLWGKTFGWNRAQITALSLRLQLDRRPQVSSENQSVWLSAVRNSGGLIVAAAMAERLTVPGTDGPIDLVESTEWRTREGYQRNGFAPAALASLNAQILGALRNSPNGRPLIFAETNHRSRAYKMGAAVGMTKPSRIYAPQILQRNLTINDGLEPKKGLRDFHFLRLPQDAIDGYYGDKQVDAMNELLVETA